MAKQYRKCSPTYHRDPDCRYLLVWALTFPFSRVELAEYLIEYPRTKECKGCQDWHKEDIIDDMNSVWFGLGPDNCTQPQRGAISSNVPSSYNGKVRRVLNPETLVRVLLAAPGVNKCTRISAIGLHISLDWLQKGEKL